MAAPLIFLIGQTASGKSRLAMQLAEYYPVELISMDSAQVYRGMDIGTAKPAADARARVPHHLLDIRDPGVAYSAAEFARDAAQLVADIRARGRLPIIAGGTFLYMRALVEGLSRLPPARPDIRAELAQQAAQQGWPALHARLARVDPVSAARIHPHDAQRIQRALEIQQASGRAMSAHLGLKRDQAWPGAVLKLCVEVASVDAARHAMARRFHRMMDSGLLDEVRALHRRDDLDGELPSLRSVGYRQLWQHLEGEFSLAEAVDRAIIATHQYAKRQRTWLRRENERIRLPVDPVDCCAAAKKHIDAFLDRQGA